MSQKTKTKQKEDETVDDVVIPIKSVDESATVEERLTKNAYHSILPARYLLRDDDGNIIEEQEDLFRRVAQNVAEAEETKEDQELWASEIQHLMETQQFIFNSPTLMNAGTDIQQLAACFVRSPGDDMEDIFQAAQDAAMVFKSGGGLGYSFSHLRPKGATVSSTGGASSGPLSFMQVYDTTCQTVEQGGKRRGAQMGIMRVDHADIGRFVTAKRGEDNLTNFNISVALTDEFTQAMENDDLYTFYDPEENFDIPQQALDETIKFYSPAYQNNPVDFKDSQNSGRSGELVDENLWRDYADRMKTVTGESLRGRWEDDERIQQIAEYDGDDPFKLPAAFIWDLIIDGAHNNGEPGIIHIDEINRQHSFDTDEHPEHWISSTNPCSEQPLEEYEACNLGHVNLSLMVEEDATTYQQYLDNEGHEYSSDIAAVSDYLDDNVDWDQLQHVVRAGTRALDNVATMSDFPVDDIEQKVSEMRKIGLGVMGWAQMLTQMGIEYGSDASFEAARVVMRFIDKQATQMSHELAKERGSFPDWEDSKYANPTEYPEWFYNHTYESPEEWEDGYPMRNHNVTTVAPTGTTSMIADTSGGIEPVYSVASFKNVGDDIQGDDMLVEFDDYFFQTLKENGYDIDEVKRVAEEKMRNNEFDGVSSLPVSDEIAGAFITTSELDPEQHVKMQRAFQEYVDSGLSKTINLPNDADHEDVHEAFSLAVSDDAIGKIAKGTTVYRDGSRDEQVLTTRVDNKLDEEDVDLDNEDIERAKKVMQVLEIEPAIDQLNAIQKGE